MKAIVLTCDAYHPFCDHMIACYRELWPDNPFTFRVAYQNESKPLQNKFGSKIEMIQTPREIKSTVLELLHDLPDDEFVYWCIDDKYPLYLQVDAIAEMYQWLVHNNDTGVDGLAFCRGRALKKEAHLYLNDTLTFSDQHFIRRRNFNQFWLHQFFRVSVIRSLLEKFPDRDFVAKEMDTFILQNDDAKLAEPIPQQLKCYVSKDNNAVFGESTTSGKILSNCAENMCRMGISVPRNRETLPHKILIGEFPS